MISVVNISFGNKFIWKVFPFLASLLILSVVLPLTITTVYGHGVAGEILPPVKLDGKLVTLEVSSSTNNPNKPMNDRQISLSLIDFNSKITLRDVTFLITAKHGNHLLFEKEFKSNNGFIVFNFISEDTSTIVVEEENKKSFFESLLGLESRKVDVKGPKLSEGGLYRFDIKILTVDDYSNKLVEPLAFNSAISIPETSIHEINDPDFGKQNLRVTTYYDKISNFQYNPSLKEITFSMPFEWSESNINQTSVVHEELVIPKTFGDLLVSGFSIYVNEIKLPENVVVVDYFTPVERTVHFMISQKELFDIFENTSNQNGMNFVIKPDQDYTHLSSITDNGQFRILVSWEPENLKSNSNVKIIFDIMDIFLKNRPISTNYEFSMTQNDRVIFEQSGTSSDSKDEHNIAEFMIPDDVTGIVHLNFNHLDNNNHAKTTIPIVINRITNQNNEIPIPEWIRNNALWWSQEQIDDDVFVSGIQYLIKERVMKISPIERGGEHSSQEIPEWIKNNAGWWADEQIDDDAFLQGIQFLIKEGIIKVS